MQAEQVERHADLLRTDWETTLVGSLRIIR
jgi:hypothetical protein